MSTVQERRPVSANSFTVSVTRVINEVIVANEHLPKLMDALWWLTPDAIELEAHRYLVVLDVACDNVALAPGYCQRRLRKAAIDLGVTVATGDQEIVGQPLPA